MCSADFRSRLSGSILAPLSVVLIHVMYVDVSLANISAYLPLKVIFRFHLYQISWSIVEDVSGCHQGVVTHLLIFNVLPLSGLS